MQLSKDFKIKDISIIRNKESIVKLKKYNKLNNYSEKLDSWFLYENINNMCNVNLKLINKPTHKRFKKENNFDLKIGMLSLAPSDVSGYELCPCSGDCESFCTGHRIKNKDKEEKETISDKSQLIYKTLKTLALKENQDKFMELLSIEISNFVSENSNSVIRLNGYSDLNWMKKRFSLPEKTYLKIENKFKNLLDENCIYSDELLQKIGVKPSNKIINEKNLDSYNIFELFSGILFYDYTKYPPNSRSTKHKNYHLVYSYDKYLDSNIKRMKKEHTICVIVEKSYKKELLNEELFVKYNHVILLNGDSFDCRYLDAHFFKKDCLRILLLETVDANNSKTNDLNNSSYVIKKKEDLDSLISKLK